MTLTLTLAELPVEFIIAVLTALLGVLGANAMR